jgi:hypothetical protein
MNNKVLSVAAVGESATGLALVTLPSPVGRALLGEDLSGAAVPVARVAGSALIALAVACWPGGESGHKIGGMLTYSVLITVLLFVLGLEGKWVGPALWPAFVVHTLLTALLARVALAARNARGKPGV